MLPKTWVGIAVTKVSLVFRELHALRLNVHYTPATVRAESLPDKTAVVIDVLRATTTIVHAIANGAAEVFPCLEIEDARNALTRMVPVPLLGGERGGVKISGFDLGNSPAEYSAERISGRSIVFTTTNGTRAMQACRGAKQVLLAGFVNLSAVCELLLSEPAIEVVCAGTDGRVTAEDTFLAGAIAYQLKGREMVRCLDMNDEAEIAMAAWQSVMRKMEANEPLASILAASQGGRNLIEIGHSLDIDHCAKMDQFRMVPILDTSTWRIRAVC